MSMDNPYQRYLMLSSQQENLRRRMFTRVTPPLTSPTTAQGYASPNSSPSESPHSDSYSPHNPYSFQSRPLHPVPAIPGYGYMQFSPNTESDNKALYQINQQIKAALTELLNNDSVKHDDKFRAWIQDRLMDAEMELKRQRRRRSSASVDNKDIAHNIAEHFDPHHHGSLKWSPTF